MMLSDGASHGSFGERKSPARERKKTRTWSDLVLSHVDVLTATDFLTTEVWTKRGLATCQVPFFIHVATRRVQVAGVTPDPNESWMTQVARDMPMVDAGFLEESCYLIHDRDGKCCKEFDETLKAAGVKPVNLPAQSPNLSSYVGGWVRSVKDECLSKLLLSGEASLRRAPRSCVEHFHRERNHQGKDSLLLFPGKAYGARDRPIRGRERLGGISKYYHRGAA